MSKPIQDTIIQEALADRASAQQTDQDIVDPQIEASNSLPAIPVNPTELSPKEALIQLAQKMGWRLLRLKGKKPFEQGWPDSAGLTADEAIQHPGNLGIICGEPSGRLFIVDIDGECPDGLPETPTVITGSGGQHLYYRLPEGIELVKANKVSHVATKVDIRWTGGQVVAPGSIHPETGGLYNWMPGLSPYDVPIVDVPQWVIDELLAPKEKPKKTDKKKPTKKPAPKLPKRAITGSQLHSSAQYRSNVLKAAAEEMRNAPIGQRNDTLNAKAYALAGFLELSEDEITDTLLEAARDAGLNDFEACGTIKSGFDAGRKAPHQSAVNITHGLPYKDTSAGK